jgi:hypothetical protein
MMHSPREPAMMSSLWRAASQRSHDERCHNKANSRNIKQERNRDACLGRPYSLAPVRCAVKCTADGRTAARFGSAAGLSGTHVRHAT